MGSFRMRPVKKSKKGKRNSIAAYNQKAAYPISATLGGIFCEEKFCRKYSDFCWLICKFAGQISELHIFYYEQPKF